MRNPSSAIEMSFVYNLKDTRCLSAHNKRQLTELADRYLQKSAAVQMSALRRNGENQELMMSITKL